MLKKIFIKIFDPGYKLSKKARILYVLENIIIVLAIIWAGPVWILMDEGQKSTPLLVFIISLAVILSITFIGYTVYKQLKKYPF